MSRRYKNSNDFDLNYPKEEKRMFGKKQLFSSSGLSTDLSDQIDQLNNDTLKENGRVKKFLQFLRNGKFGGSQEVIILRKENERLKKMIKKNQFKKGGDFENDLKDCQEELLLKNDELAMKENEIQSLNRLLTEKDIGGEEDLQEKLDSLQLKLDDYRKKYYAEKKKVNDIKRNNMRMSNQINEIQNKMNETGGTKNGGFGQSQGNMKEDDYANLKHELMYEYDLLLHLKQEFDNMINEVEGNQEEEEEDEEDEENEDEEDEEVVDTNFFNEN